VVPVIQLCRKFGLPAGEKTVDTCIIIVETDLSGETISLGVMVDSIREVLTLEKTLIEPTPRIGMRINTGYIKGIGKKGNDFIILLDINRLMSEEAALKNAETVSEG
jgi:chemotaxis signal transduction protein